MVSLNKSISMKLEDAPVFAEFEALAKKEGYHSSSAYIVALVKKEVKEHGKSHNPQTVITMFDRETVKAIPNIYSQDEQSWLNFYKMLTPVEYDELTKRIAWLDNLHRSAKIL